MSADAAFPGGKTACAGDIGPLYRERAHPARPRRHPAFGRNYYAGHMSAFPAATEDARHGTTGLAERYRAVRARSIALARSEEHTSELQSLMRISYAVFCLKKKNNNRSQSHIYYYTINIIDIKSTLSSI